MLDTSARIEPCACPSLHLLPRCCPAPLTLAWRRGMAVRAQVGWLSNTGVSRRRRDPAAEPRREAHEPILPRAHRPTGRHAIRTLRGEAATVVGRQPDWSELSEGLPNSPSDYHFLAVDGGATDNEPIALGRTALAGVLRRNPRDPKEANRPLF